MSDMLATPKYQILKDIKDDLLIDPKEATIDGLVEVQVDTPNSKNVSSAQPSVHTSSPQLIHPTMCLQKTFKILMTGGHNVSLILKHCCLVDTSSL